MKYLNLALSILFTLCTLLLVGFSVFIYLAITREPSTFMYCYGGLIILSSCSAGILYLMMAKHRWVLFIRDYREDAIHEEVAYRDGKKL